MSINNPPRSSQTEPPESGVPGHAQSPSPMSPTQPLARKSFSELVVARIPEAGLLLLGLAGYGVAQLIAFVGTNTNPQSASFTGSADYHLFAAVLGIELFFYFAMAPIIWRLYRRTSTAIGLHYKRKFAVLSLLGFITATLILPFLVPELPQVATLQTRRTDLSTLLAFVAVVAPAIMGTIAVRSYAQARPPAVDLNELISVVSRLRRSLRFYLVTLALTIVIGICVLASIRFAVSQYASAGHVPRLTNVGMVFPIEYIVLYGCAFSLILVCIYAPAEAQLSSYVQAECQRLYPLDWNARTISERLPILAEVESRLEMSFGQRFARWVAILAPLITGILAAIGKS